MPDTSTILSLPYILPAQAQKHVTHNDALRMLDVIVQLAVQDRTRSLPPAAPAEGDRHLVAAGAGGAWAGQAGKIAVRESGAWQFLTPQPGWQAWIAAEAAMAVFSGGLWQTAGDAPLEVAELGVSASPDATNRLVVASTATLFSHAGAGHQMKINKALGSDSASLMFQTGYAARAELGTLGSEDFTLRVTPDGASYHDALTVAAATGVVSLPEGVSTAGFALRDAADDSKRAVFAVSGSHPTGTTRTYTLPLANGELAGLAGNQTFSGNKTFSGTVTVSGTTASLGTSTANASYTLGSGATLSGNSKTVNIGTGGVSGSVTTISVGSSVAGAEGSLEINSPNVSFASSVVTITAPAAAVSAQVLGLGGASGDATNRLSVNAPATLFNHDGAGHQLKLNKAAPGDTASLTFQTGYSARAEMGTTGSDDFAIKVSADGLSFVQALTAEAASGRIGLPQGLGLGGLASDPASPVDGMVWLHSASGEIRMRSGGATVVAGAASLADGSRGDVEVSDAGTAWSLAPAVKYGVQIALGQKTFFN